MINIQEIIVANSTGAALLIVSMIASASHARKKLFSERIFDAIIWITLISLATETVSFLIDGVPGRFVRFLQYATNAYLFIAAVTIAGLWVLYVDLRIFHSIKRLRKWLYWLIPSIAFVSAMLICDVCGVGMIFSINDKNEYSRGSCVLLTYLFVFIDYILTLVLALTAVLKHNHVKFFPVHYFVIPCLVGTIVQNRFYGITVGWLSVAVAIQFVLMYASNHNAFIDGLSGLYNRNYFNGVYDKLGKAAKKRSVGGIMLDIDRFKAINDVYGHSAGDEAIRCVGGILAEISTENVHSFRIGGDEFVVLCIGKEEDFITRTTREIESRLAQFNASGVAEFELSLSMGQAMYDPTESDPDKFLRVLDLKMYEQKALRADSATA